ncbi:MAG: NifU family protein [Candidatus Harrisonbacteria bacterium]|nr:NifU family protein [Candidatus Harrisonbacteria bacterium]
MNIHDFFASLKGNGQELLNGLDELRKRLGLERLYLIYANEQEIVWGTRGTEVDYENVARELLKFVQEHTGLNYDTEMTRLVVFGNEMAEVDYVLNKELIPYIESHEGRLEIVSISENTGEIVVSLRGACGTCPSAIFTMKAGIERTLKSLLPWVKTVKSFDKPEEPDEKNDFRDYGGEG